MNSSLNQPLMSHNIFKDYQFIQTLVQGYILTRSLPATVGFFIMGSMFADINNNFAPVFKDFATFAACVLNKKIDKKYKVIVSTAGIALGAVIANIFYLRTPSLFFRGAVCGLHNHTIVSFLTSKNSNAIRKNDLLLSRVHLASSIAFTIMLQNPIIANTLAASVTAITQVVAEHFDKKSFVG